MSSSIFPTLFTPVTIGKMVVRNRIVSTGHDTVLPEDGAAGDALIAYQEARARGGAGLIVVQVAGVHRTARYTSHMLMAADDSCIPGLRELAARCHSHGAKVISQIFHPGREVMEGDGGLLMPALSASSTPSERFRTMPRRMRIAEIREVIDAYGAAAARIAAAGLDGVEILASQGYLPAQFFDHRVNRREDEYGAANGNRTRFLSEVIASVRAQTPPGFVVGMRVSGGDRDEDATTPDEALEIIGEVAAGLDYVSVVAGTSASLCGAIHIAPPMTFQPGYLAPFAALVKQRVSIPVIVTGRINQPHAAEAIVSSGQADLCGMTRAMICDPEMPQKAMEDRPEDIRACIGCNQACIGHFHKGVPISCIQRPETGRELRFGALSPTDRPKRVLVAGGGPAGMKAALELAKRGHQVMLHEAGPRLGGAVALAHLLPHREEFGGLVPNLVRELRAAGVRPVINSRVDSAMVRELAPDTVVVAVGGAPYVPAYDSMGSMPVAHAESVLLDSTLVGNAVVVYDLRSDWVGIGIAELLAKEGRRVILAVPGTHIGESLPLYVRDDAVARLHRLGVEMRTYLRLYGHDDDTVYMRHTASGDPVELAGMAGIVFCTGRHSEGTLHEELEGLGPKVISIGDALAPRTVEEAIYEGLVAGSAE